MADPRTSGDRFGIGAVTAAVLTSVLVLGSGCGESGGDAARSEPAFTGDPGPLHVHAVGVDPVQPSAVILAAHTGLFRWAPNGGGPGLIGTSRQDTMGFTVIGPNRYLGSGHPDLRTGAPPLLGLIGSVDGGHRWTSISLRGKADFHVLRAAGTRVVGIDSQTGLVFVSDDGGRRWTNRTPPGELVDLVLDAADADHVLASTPGGLTESRDAGRTWRSLAGSPGYLSWPAGGPVFRVAPDGKVTASEDGGLTWELRGDLGGAPSAFAAVDASRLLATTHDGALKESRDGGAGWDTLTALG